MKKVNPNGSKTIYVGGLYEEDKTSGGTITRKVTYYPVAGAMRINSTLYYTLKDHLGSASVVTDSTGVIVGETRFFPYGETRFTTGTMYTDKLYTGQREMTGLGIYHYGARFYSPKLGRFLSADSIVPGMSNPQNLNRYMYVRGNPLKYTDPSGHDSVCGSSYSDPECEDVTTTTNNNNNNNGNSGGGNNGGNNTNNPDPAAGEIGLPPAPVMIANPDPLDLGLQQDSGSVEDDSPEELTIIDLIGQAITFALIEVFILLPIDYGLFVVTGDLAVACGGGVALACIAEIPILAIDLVVADFQISLAYTVAQNVTTGTRHEFEWLIIPKLLEWVGGE